MKKIAKGISLLLGATFVLSGLAGCNGGNPTTKVDGETITIKCVKAGFGTDWLYELKGKFETAYAAEGYKVNILTPDRSINGETVVQELALGYNASNVDLYITGDATPDMVGALGQYSDKGSLVEDLEDLVYNQPAIAYDGTEESKTVLQKAPEEVLPFMTDSTGELNAFNWAQSSAGMVVNTRKLAKYGLEIPKTTNELFDCFAAIYCGSNGVENSLKSRTYPLTYVPGNNGYAVCFLNTVIAQYDGDFYEQFWSMETKDENGNVVPMEEDGYEVFNNEAIYEMLKIAYRTFDMKVSAPGSTNQGLDQAQAKVMGDLDGAVFMFNGDWMLNEVKLNYKTKLHDIDFVNFPVISALGVKLFGEGTTYNLSEADCDALLSAIIDLVDENKSIEEIIASISESKGITLTEADAAEVARARGVSYSRGVEHFAYIAKGTPKKDIAAKFLRMMASDDFGRTFSVKANSATPYYSEENTTSEYAFVRNASKVPANKYYTLISSGAQGYRKQVGSGLLHMFTSVAHIPDEISSKEHASIFDREGGLSGETPAVYATLAEKMQKSEYDNASKNWDGYKKAAGLD